MPQDQATILDSLSRHAPFDMLTPETRADLAPEITRITADPGQVLFHAGDPLDGLYLIETGLLDIISQDGDLITQRGPGDVMGERALMRDDKATLGARVAETASFLMIPARRFRALMADVPAFAEWFRPGKAVSAEVAGASDTGLTSLQVSDLMTGAPLSCPPNETVQAVARTMRDKSISSLLVMDNKTLNGIITVHDMTNKVLAEGLGGDVLVSQVMTPDPITISPDALGLDALLLLANHKFNHLPVAKGDRVVGMLTRTDLIRQQATTASHIAADIVQCDTAEDMAKVMERVPKLLAQLVSEGVKHQAITRRITNVTDAITRRLLVLAERKLGPPPVPYLWLACGSQGRQEQTGISDQDNCLILDDAFKPEHDTYFAQLAQFVCDGLNTCGFVYCPGDMMATTPRWRQPRKVWRDYFTTWINEPDNEAQMLASVMFDLRPISGESALFENLQHGVLKKAKGNSIFVAHMVSNSLKHTPPLSLFRGFALIRSGEHKNTIDLKLSGVVPVVDLARVYALQGAFEAANTRERLELAQEHGIISPSGASDLLDAYDMIAETRLRHQAAQLRKDQHPDNFLSPVQLSELERNHLRDAFMVIKTMQSALGRGS